MDSVLRTTLTFSFQQAVIPPHEIESLPEAAW